MQCRTETKAWFYKFWYLAVFSRVNWNSLCSDNAEVTNWHLQEEKLFTRVVYWCSTNQPSLSSLVVHSLLFIIFIGALTLLLFTCKKTGKVFNHYYRRSEKKFKTSFTVLRHNSMTFRSETFIGKRNRRVLQRLSRIVAIWVLRITTCMCEKTKQVKKLRPEKNWRHRRFSKHSCL